MNGNQVFNQIFKEQVDSFYNSFQNSSKNLFYNPNKKNNLHHAGEFGVFREKLIANFLKMFVPSRLVFDSGFVISPKEEVSKQTDLILFDKNESPLIQTDEGQKFFPIETIASIGEVKSSLDLKTLKTELNNIVRYKQLRQNLNDRIAVFSRSPLGISENKIATQIIPDPKQFPNDQISTFLICSKFNFKVNEDTAHEIIESLYNEGTDDRHKVDFILSLEDGFIGYYDKAQKKFALNCNYPGDLYQLDMVKADFEDYYHVKQFVNLFYNRVFLTTILKPEISEYIS